MVTGLLMALAVLLDRLLGESRRAHPLMAFGRIADALEREMNRGEQRQWRGLLAWLLMVMPLTLLAWALACLPQIGWLFSVLLLYLAIGLRSLGEHAQPVAQALQVNDLPRARHRVSYMVSRQTTELDATAVAAATTESVLENGSDAVFAALFWFAVLGAPGVVLYRLANTLDAMWGYRNDRFHRFGWAAARLDDLLNWLPARLVALTYALLGNTRQAWSCWRRQAPQWDSPNAGPVMAAGAGALNVRLGGAAIYHGELHERPLLGAGRPAVADDIDRALRLVRGGVWLWLVVALAFGAVWHA
ncbi:adenosylcobinamide-phosphate synthase CbiB [Halopseudomonas bauzanensis]|uniref:Cobalamin biosynthesis protein CobD n=1 Tax=Halopseudomonas bauzanensis TaxID=653930 RepID=A0A4U0YKI2_9GAMM|nr:adenosylcobinamide-phosphate synthase CbiB [Halopseudomonas bauzanensis]TKA90224.1 cobalamin biosynthesis protein [Halopseudomonas bauzanensis]